MECNHCGSLNCENNHLSLDAIDAMDLPIWLLAGARVAARIVNQDRPGWVCNDCGNRF